MNLNLKNNQYKYVVGINRNKISSILIPTVVMSVMFVWGFSRNFSDPHLFLKLSETGMGDENRKLSVLGSCLEEDQRSLPSLPPAIEIQ